MTQLGLNSNQVCVKPTAPSLPASQVRPRALLLRKLRRISFGRGFSFLDIRCAKRCGRACAGRGFSKERNKIWEFQLVNFSFLKRGYGEGDLGEGVYSLWNLFYLEHKWKQDTAKSGLWKKEAIGILYVRLAIPGSVEIWVPSTIIKPTEKRRYGIYARLNWHDELQLVGGSGVLSY